MEMHKSLQWKFGTRNTIMKYMKDGCSEEHTCYLARIQAIIIEESHSKGSENVLNALTLFENHFLYSFKVESLRLLACLVVHVLASLCKNKVSFS